MVHMSAFKTNKEQNATQQQHHNNHLTAVCPGLLNVFSVYAPHTGKPEEEKESFWDNVFHLVSCIPQNEMVVFAGDMNGHVGSSNAGYDGTHGGFGYGSRNADGTRILEFADGLNLVICNTLFTKQEAKLVIYVAGPVKSS